MLPENGIVGLADLAALEIETGYRRQPHKVQRAALTRNLRSLEKLNLRAASIRSNESSESLMLFIRTHQLLIPFECDPVSADDRESETHAAKRSGRSK